MTTEYLKQFPFLKFFLFVLSLFAMYLVYFIIFYKEECPDDYQKKEIYPIEFFGKVTGKSYLCAKYEVGIYFKIDSLSKDLLFTGTHLYLNIRKEYTCMVNDLSIGDSVVKFRDFYEFKVFKTNNQVATYSYNFNLDTCSCNDNFTSFPKDTNTYYDVVNFSGTDFPLKIKEKTFLDF